MLPEMAAAAGVAEGSILVLQWMRQHTFPLK